MLTLAFYKIYPNLMWKIILKSHTFIEDLISYHYKICATLLLIKLYKTMVQFYSSVSETQMINNTYALYTLYFIPRLILCVSGCTKYYQSFYFTTKKRDIMEPLCYYNIFNIIYK